MRQLTLQAPRAITWLDVPEPDLEDDGQALVRPLAVATCDMDHALVTGGTPFPTPVALGHEGVCEVVAVGRAVRSVRVGDRVVVPFQISCGTCEACRLGGTDRCARAGFMAMYGFGAFGGGFGGMLSDLVRVPYADAMLVALPDGIEPTDVASASDNLPDAYRLVAPFLARRPGADVLVLGGTARSIGLYAVALARALGAGRVAYHDDDPGRLALASDLGADVLEADPERGSFPIVGDASGHADGLRLAIRATEGGGDCTHAGVLLENDVSLPLLEMYSTGVHLYVGRCAARPAIPHILGLVAADRLRPGLVTDRIVPWDDAGAALLEPHTKLVFARHAAA